MPTDHMKIQLNFLNKLHGKTFFGKNFNWFIH